MDAMALLPVKRRNRPGGLRWWNTIMTDIDYLREFVSEIPFQEAGKALMALGRIEATLKEARDLLQSAAASLESADMNDEGWRSQASPVLGAIANALPRLDAAVR